MNLDKHILTSNIDVRILRYVLQSWYNSIHDILYLQIGNNLFEFVVCDTSDFRFNIVEVLDIVGQERFKVVFTHSLRQSLNLRNQLIPNSPRKLVGDQVEVRLQSGRGFNSSQFYYCVYKIDFV